MKIEIKKQISFPDKNVSYGLTINNSMILNSKSKESAELFATEFKSLVEKHLLNHKVIIENNI